MVSFGIIIAADTIADDVTWVIIPYVYYQYGN
jgi:hypothetical protein